VIGVSLIFMTSVILLSTMALYPPFLQTLMGYPVLTAGTVLAPRGFGTMAAMFMVGRLIGRIDPRYLALFGLGLSALTLWFMSGFTAEVSQYTIVWTGILQGFGLGFIFVPVSTMSFQTLAPDKRTEAAGLFSLMRNVGGSIGIAVVTAMLSEHQQMSHAMLAQHVSPLNPMFRAPYLPDAWSLDSAQGLAQLNDEISRQAMTIAYVDDFLLLMLTALAAAPMLLFLRGPKRASALARAAE
jgi:DHA2 family multidrug resistance protein